MAKQKFVLAEEQKEAYRTIIGELKSNHNKGKTTKGSMKMMDRALKTLGFPADEVDAAEDLYFI